MAIFFYWAWSSSANRLANSEIGREAAEGLGNQWGWLLEIADCFGVSEPTIRIVDIHLYEASNDCRFPCYGICRGSTRLFAALVQVQRKPSGSNILRHCLPLRRGRHELAATLLQAHQILPRHISWLYTRVFGVLRLNTLSKVQRDQHVPRRTVQ
jgi:hypothetical protein